MLNFINDITKGHNWLTRGRTIRNERRRHNPPLANGFSQQRIREEQTATGLRRSYFGNHAVSVGNKHRFAACGKANVFAEPVLEHFETDRPHLCNSSYQKLHLSTPPLDRPSAILRNEANVRRETGKE